MSSSSDSSRRPSQHILPEQTEGGKQPEVRRSSKYDIYGTTTKPFGESYRKSLLLQGQGEDLDQDSGNGPERGDSSLDTDSVEETMGCSTSRTEVAMNEETVKGTFTNADNKSIKQVMSEVKIKTEKHTGISVNNGTDKNNTKLNKSYSTNKTERLSDFEIIYGAEKTNNIHNNDGYSTIDIYSEVKKPEKSSKEKNPNNETNNKTQREKLMQQIRDRRDDTKEKKETAYSTITKVNKDNEEQKNKKKNEKEEENTAISSKNLEDKIINTIVTSAPISFVEEEYSYEPDKKQATSKLVVRSRSLLGLDENQFNYNSTLSCTLKRPNTLKLTTKPDGTIRYGVRQDSSEHDLMGDDADEQTSQLSEMKNNYVSSIKSAFDAANVSQNQNKTEKAEAFDGLRQYFHDNKHGLQELLINNNVVIIEPFRPDPPRSPSDKSDSGSQRTCRITGATIKSPVSEQKQMLLTSNTLPRRHTKSRQDTRQGFYHPIKVNKELIDAELPDPDKVKTARELFENVVKSKCVSEIPSKKPPSKPIFNTIDNHRRIIPEVKIIQEGKQTSIDKRRHGRFIIDQVTREDMRRYPLYRKWTDSGSLSSGVSSDFSCDQDCEFHHHDELNNGSSQEVLHEYSSDDEDAYIYPYDDHDRHPVAPEVLQKIRACGTTVTYYGGKVISRSHGQFRSPMTMTIMDEIRQNEGAGDGRKGCESDPEEPYLGVKFRLVKSNSCGSRLEIAGTEEDCGTKLISPRHESFRGKSIAEEVTEVKEQVEETKEEMEEDNPERLMEDEEDKAEADRYVTNVDVCTPRNPQVMTWAELKLKEARKQWHCAPEAVRMPPQDMEFETFEVLDESKPHKVEKNETGRG